METNVTIMQKLKSEVLPGINLFESILFTIATIVGTIFFILSFTIWKTNSSDNQLFSSLLALIDIPLGVLAATFLSKRSKWAPLLLSVDALLYGSANFFAGQIALALVNFIYTPIMYLIAFFFIWPRETIDPITKEVKTRKLNLLTGLLIVISIILVATIFGVVLTVLNNNEPKYEHEWINNFSMWFDVFAATLMMFAVASSVFRFRETWYFYLTSNIIKIFLFSSLLIFEQDIASIQLLILALTYLINALFGLVIWRQSELKELKTKEA